MWRAGITLVELTVVLALVGVVTALAAPRFGGWLDRLAVSRAVLETASFYQTARYSAVFQSTRVRVELSPERLIAAFEGITDSVFLERPGPAAEGVELDASRTVIRIYPNGLGAGGANLTLRFRRGAYEEKLTVSRVGRLKRW